MWLGGLLLLLRRNTEVCPPTELVKTSIDTAGDCYVPLYMISLLILQLLFQLPPESE